MAISNRLSAINFWCLNHPDQFLTSYSQLYLAMDILN